ncbi:S41 family peptidase [Desulfonema magnum]|uniref:Protease domain-containing protein n=1 Tax=Desulfonema magnum TaxID=45655 RepID=A0A975GLW4_9BACT|nr:S41 family peptidase [Desulfonema magnum]QTA85228.1 Protease domain-containing protein [Desulfonema magnum]
MKKQLRLRRLHMLADIWGKVYLFHPAIVCRNIGADWNRVLLKMIPKIENTADSAQAVSALNDGLFRWLDDPLTFARQKPSPDLSAEDCKPESSEFSISDKITSILGIGPDSIRSKSFLNQLSQVSETLRNAKRLIVDLRWRSPYDKNLPHTFLRFFADSPCRGIPEIRRVHHGWNEDGEPYIYRQTWEVSHGIRVNPFSEPEHFSRIPLVFVVNNSSVSHFWQQLSALQSLPRIRVIWEQTGSFSIPRSEAITYNEDIEVHLNALLSRFQPDLVRPAPIPSHELPAVAEQVLAEKSKYTSPLFPPPMQFPEPEPISDRLSREERLMGLLKTWVILRHFFPLFDVRDWDALLYKWIPKAEAAPDLKAYYRVLKALTVQLHDSHAHVRHPAIEKSAAIPVRLKYAEEKVVIGEISEAPGISLGDEVIRINDTSVDSLETQFRLRISASSDQAFYRDFLGRMVMGEKGKELKLTVRNAGRLTELSLRFMEPTQEKGETERKATVPFFAMPPAAKHIRILENNLGYMTPFTMAGVKILDNAFHLLENTDGLIIDLRGYPKTHFQQELIRRLCRETVCSPRYEIPVAAYPDADVLKWSVIQYVIKPDRNGYVYDKPVVALTDETTQSSAEDFCMYLRNANRAVFVGSPTAGCHGNMAFADLPGGGWLSFTGMRVTWPDGTPFQGIGIIPDVRVSPTIRALRQGRDEILEQGIRTLKGLITN